MLDQGLAPASGLYRTLHPRGFGRSSDKGCAWSEGTAHALPNQLSWPCPSSSARGCASTPGCSWWEQDTRHGHLVLDAANSCRETFWGWLSLHTSIYPMQIVGTAQVFPPFITFGRYWCPYLGPGFVLNLTEGKTGRERMGVCRNGVLFTAHLPQHRGWRQTPSL